MNTDTSKDFPRISLSAARLNANLTQKQFAAALGVSESTVIAWENGKRLPNLKFLQAIEDTLGMSLNHIRFKPE